MTDGTSREKAILSTLSIAFADSDDTNAKVIVRNGDTLEDGKDLIVEFLIQVEAKARKFQEEKVPAKFLNSLETIAKIESERRETWKNRKNEGIPDSENKLELFPVAWKQWLRSMCTYRIYGYNSSRFDARVLAPGLFDILLTELSTNGSDEKTKKKINVLKRNQSYFNLSFQLPCTGVKIQFCDICSYLSPMTLAKFLEMTDAPAMKGVFPYQYFFSVAQLKECKEFPPMDAFYSDLKSGLTCTDESYKEAKEIYDNRCSLPADNPDKWETMEDYLCFYNELDVIPLISAIKSWFRTFESQFGIDGYQFASLPSMSQAAMFRLFDKKSSFLYSLPPWKKTLSDKFKNGIIGGLCTTLHRSILLDGSDGPDSAKIAPNGDPYTCCIPFDFNS